VEKLFVDGIEKSVGGAHHRADEHFSYSVDDGIYNSPDEDNHPQFL
jgi:hypothetical protein